MEHLMQRVDVNQDGEIQLTEFVAGLVDWKALQNDSQWGRWVQVRFVQQPCGPQPKHTPQVAAAVYV
jgi:hypothetical protein